MNEIIIFISGSLFGVFVCGCSVYLANRSILNLYGITGKKADETPPPDNTEQIGVSGLNDYMSDSGADNVYRYEKGS